MTAFAVIPGKSHSQVDPHFSQYFIQPMTVNPAMTGLIEGDYKVAAVWRSQYGNSLTTKGISAEAPTNRNINLGVNLQHQSSSDGSYTYTTGYMNFAYTGVHFGDHHMVLAVQGGLINRRFNINKLHFGDQWVAGTGFDPSVATSEVFFKPSATTFDAGTGIAYYDGTPGRKVALYGGVAAFHLTRPTDPFLNGGDKKQMPVRYAAHAGARININETFDLIPNMLYMRQGNAQEKMIGAYAQMFGAKDTDLMFGANYRFDDAISPFFGVYHKGVTLGLSYDTNASKKTNGSINRSSMEVSLSFTGWGGNSEISSKPFYCPRF
ncbi:MAG: type IX secretion system membrane protein PorP/SprF [Chitinophagaceae bacterium]|nr:MAG: type IX secretion system membrane protein PorP/SprF [Chitinophagaceae bacterium]